MLEALIQWLHEGRMLAGELTATKEGRTAWVGIYPLRLDRPGTITLLKREGLIVFPGADVRVYRVRLFEIADSLLESYFSEEDMENKQSFIVLGDDALFEKLKCLGISPDVLDSHARGRYPL